MTGSTTRRFLYGLATMYIAATPLASFAAGEDDFQATYEAYQAASAEGRLAEAAAHADQARRLGETLFADDVRRMATLTYNHGDALSKAGRYGDAYGVLGDARQRMRVAYGEDAPELVQVEIALFTAAPSSAVRKHLRRAERAARLHELDESTSIAQAKLMVGMRVRGRQGIKLLEEATSVFEQRGDSDGVALGNFWLGKIRARHNWGDPAEDFEAALVHARRGQADRPTQRSLELMAHAALVAVLEESGLSEEATRHCLAIGRLTPWGGKSDYRPLYRKLPKYPTVEAKRSKGGWVRTEFDVDESGFVRDAKVIASDGGDGFETAALEAVRGFRYAPKFVDGEAVAVEGVRNLMTFEIGTT